MPLPFPGLDGSLEQLLHHLREIEGLLRRDPKYRPPNIRIHGIEKSQCIQFFAPPSGQGSGLAPPNSIPLVEDKPTIVRVYVSLYDPDPFPIPTVTFTGTLQIVRAGGNLTLNPLNAIVVAQPPDQIDRGAVEDTLNFRIPASECAGTLDCILTLMDPPSGATIRTGKFKLKFVNLPPVDFHSVLIHYTGVDYYDVPQDVQSDGWDVLEAIDFLLQNTPISKVNFDGCEIVKWDRKLAVGENFAALYDTVYALRAIADSSSLYLALIRQEAGCGGVCGLGGAGVALCFVGNGNNIRHEVGHAMARAHAPCGDPSWPDPNYPDYAPYPSGSIGEFGVSMRTAQIFDPQFSRDFMSYCSNEWVSPYTYLGLWDVIDSRTFTSSPVGASPRASVWRSGEAEFYHLSFRLIRSRDGSKPQVEIYSGFHLKRSNPGSPARSRSNVYIELIDTDGAILDRYQCQSPQTGCACNGPDPADDLMYLVDFPRHSRLKLVRILEDGLVVRTIAVAKNAPRVSITEVKQTRVKNSRFARVRWTAKPPGRAEDVSFCLRFSHDGKKWRGLVANSREKEAIINLDVLPGGDECVFEVLASAGLRTAVARSTPLKLPLKPRKAYVFDPDRRYEYQVGESLDLIGAAYSPDFGLCEQDDMKWYFKNKVLGIGRYLRIESLRAGQHEFILRAPDGTGGRTETATTISFRKK